MECVLYWAVVVIVPNMQHADKTHTLQCPENSGWRMVHLPSNHTKLLSDTYLSGTFVVRQHSGFWHFSWFY